MADQVIPIQDIASIGVIKDTPSISLPPNAYSDVQNVRFHAGAVRKMEGEKKIELELPTDEDVVYATYWQAPTNKYYVVVTHAEGNANAAVHTYNIANDELRSSFMPTTDDAIWQHTLFNGGFNFVLNNGVTTPRYLSDPITDNASLTDLPNWDSYLSQEDVTTVIWDEFNADISLGRAVDFTKENLLYTVTPRDASVGIINYSLTSIPVPAATPFSIDTEDDDNYIVTPTIRTDDLRGALPGDQITISIQTRASINVRAGVVRAYGNLLVAGDLTESDDDSNIIRRLPGTIRTSDVAAPGAVPLNWNPFRLGANTADEFILSSTGKVQDMAELQGVMYVYTDVSIHAIQQTGNPTIPFQISTTTDSYGANSLGAVMEFDGRHLVVGAQDIYVFAGHPGSIASVADQKIRHYAYDDDGVNTDNVRMVRNQKYDEIWIFTPDDSINEMLVWNYRTQSWTIRRQTGVVSGTQGIDSPLFATTTQVFEGDKGYMKVDETGYESFVERRRLGLTPEFDTETLAATAVMYTGFADPDVEDELNANLEIRMRGSETPSDSDGIGSASDHEMFIFDGEEDYKVDTRIHGRFINYKISDGITDDDNDIIPQTMNWNITGYQLEIMKGGKR